MNETNFSQLCVMPHSPADKKQHGCALFEKHDISNIVRACHDFLESVISLDHADWSSSSPHGGETGRCKCLKWAVPRTNNRHIYANVIPTKSPFWHRQVLISGPSDQHLSESHLKRLGFTPKACFVAEK